MHEEVARGSLGELARRFRGEVKGEIVLVIGPASSTEHDKDVGFAVDALRHLVQSGARRAPPPASLRRSPGPGPMISTKPSPAARPAGELLRHHPIYYVNAEPHLGHAYSTLAADVLARHMRQRGEEVFFLTGTDEHGEPIEMAAQREGIEPQQLADRNAAKFEALMPIIDATNDFFIRTSDPRHAKKVAEIMQRVYDNGWVRKGVYEGWYCPRCADFKNRARARPTAELPDSRDRAGARARGELVLPTLRLWAAARSSL